jgi:hypothetical protein
VQRKIVKELDQPLYLWRYRQHKDENEARENTERPINKTRFSPLSVTTYAKKAAMYHFPQTQHLPLPPFFYLQFPIPA